MSSLVRQINQIRTPQLTSAGVSVTAQNGRYRIAVLGLAATFRHDPRHFASAHVHLYLIGMTRTQ
jgi:hypothetical protein